MRPLHRPTAVDPDEENAVIRLIETGCANGNFITQRDVLNFVEGEFGKCSIYEWIHNLLCPHADRVCRAVVLSHEKPRFQIPRLF
jgi:hypothetical protein